MSAARIEQRMRARSRTARGGKLAFDWTVDPQTGRSNCSPEYLQLCTEVERLIRASAHSLIAGNAGAVADLVLAQLAHVHKLRPPVKRNAKGRGT